MKKQQVTPGGPTVTIRGMCKCHYETHRVSGGGGTPGTQQG